MLHIITPLADLTTHAHDVLVSLCLAADTSMLHLVRTLSDACGKPQPDDILSAQVGYVIMKSHASDIQCLQDAVTSEMDHLLSSDWASRGLSSQSMGACTSV